MKSITFFAFAVVTTALSSSSAVNGQKSSAKDDDQSCEICPGSTITNPTKEVLLIPAIGVQTCEALLESTTSLDSVACAFLQPFYGAICGCPATPLFSGCDLCSSTGGPFVDSALGLDIPGSKQNVEISCDAMYEGAKFGAVSPDECSTLAQIAPFCGGCVGSGGVTTTGPPTGTPTVATQQQHLLQLLNN